jgi:hypothetical protein
MDGCCCNGVEGTWHIDAFFILSCVFTGMGLSLHRVCLLPFHFGTMPSSLWKKMARNRLIAMARMISMAPGQERQE